MHDWGGGGGGVHHECLAQPTQYCVSLTRHHPSDGGCEDPHLAEETDAQGGKATFPGTW